MTDGSLQLRRLHEIHFIVYFFAGVATVLLGPALPMLSRNWRMIDAQAGSLFAFQFAGAIAGSILSTRWPRLSYPMGCCFCAIALTLTGSSPWILARPLFFLVGFGLGLIINAGNIFVTQFATASGHSEAGTLAKVHFTWGIGAVSCPWILRIMTQASRPSITFAAIGTVFAILAGILALSSNGERVKVYELGRAEHTRLPVGLQISFAVAFLLYTGTENAISGWLPSFAVRVYKEPPFLTPNGLTASNPLGSISFTLLWGAHLLGRACTPLGVRIFKESRLFAATIHSLIVSILLLTFVPGHFGDRGGAVCLAATACGLSLAAIYPLMMANMLRQAKSPRGIGWILASGPLGGALLPWLSGITSTHLGGSRAVLYVPCIAAILILLFVPNLYPEESTSRP